MSIIEKNEAAIFSRRHRNYCCQKKQYYIYHKPTLVSTLEILPRVIIYKKPLKIGNIYETLVSITNHGLHNRRLIYTTDSEDVSISVYPKCFMDNFLDAEKSIQLTICLEPKAKLNINRRRTVFIQAEHPNITFSLPIIILVKNDDTPSLPDMVMFPRTCPKTFSFYEMILYNKDSKNLVFTLKCNYPKLTMMVPTFSIAKHNYIKILMKLDCRDVNQVRNIIRLKFGLDSYEIPFVHQPIEWTLFLDTLYVKFDPIKFDRTATKSFRICNESQHDIKFHINFTEDENALSEKEFATAENLITSRNSEHSTSSSKSYQIEDLDRTYKERKSVDKFPSTHFQFEPQCGTLPSNSSCLVNVTFKPVMHNRFNSLIPPPFPIITSLLIGAQDELKCEKREVKIMGYINGPDIELIPKLIDFRTVYFGEEHCAEIQVINVDGLTNCHIDFHDFISHDDANALVTPKEGFDLKPCQSALFHLQFFAKVLGKFMVKLQFKVRNGNFFTTMVRGNSQHVRVKCFPDVLDLGIVPVCVPQKRLTLLMNPLTVPITVQCFIPEDGIETPLVLNVTDVDETLPIHIKDPVYHLKQCHQDEQQNEENEKCIENQEEEQKPNIFESTECEDIESSLLTYHSIELDDNSSYSTEFQEQTLDHIPGMASNLLSYLKKIKIFDKPEMEKTVVDEALNSLLTTTYFYDMDKYKNYCNMDWNALSSDPKEIYCNNEVIYLNPNTGKAISVVVIPNIVGRQHKVMELRVCPILAPPSEDDQDRNFQQIVDSEYLLSKLWIQYNCSVPEIMWDNVIDMQEPLYAGELYEFVMIFENCSKIGGFFYYDAIPDNDYGTMRFLNNRWKYFIEPESIERVPCAVEFKKIGFITLMGLIKFVGVNTGFPYHIKSEILPPRVNVSPAEIAKKLSVLEMVNLFVYIDNATPTTTWLSLKLKDDSHMSVYPEGAQLSPNGQGIYGTLKICFRDPGIYRNTLQIIMQYETIKKIPIILHVDGMPIFFEPEIRTQGLHIGCVLCNTEDEYLYDKPNYSKVIRVINKGERRYRLVITKTKCSESPTCTITTFRAKINVKPNNLVMESMSESYITICTNACEEFSIYNEFRVDIIDLSETTRMQSTRFVVTAQFTFPQLLWNRREISMAYYRTHKYKEQPQWEMLKLTNVADNFMESVILKLTAGPFLLKEHFEDRFVKEYTFSMMGLETKEFFVMLDKEAIRNRLNTFYEGRITCVANARVQKSVYLKVNMLIPTLTIKQNDIILFTNNTEGVIYIQLQNTGPVQTIYKWKKLQEECHYINEEENSQQFVDIILSDIIHRLDLETIDFENDSETNMTKRYQKLRCYLHKPDDHVDIRRLIHGIIDDLDLCHKRYKLECQEPLPPAEPDPTQALNKNYIDEVKILKDPTNILENQIDEALEKMFQQHYEQSYEQIREIENQLNSKTLFFNRKFLADLSSLNSESQTCVYHTLDHVLGNLKLYDSFSISQPSSDTCKPNTSVYFFEKCGILEEHQSEMCALHIPAIREGYEVRAAFQLDVMGCKAQEFHITMVNLDKTLKLSKDSVYLGLKPWYEHFKTNIALENVTCYQISLSLSITTKPSNKLPKLANGYVKILNEKLLIVPALQKAFLTMEGSMGFNEEFIREIRININDSDEMNIRLRGQGVMPMLAVADHRLSFVEQDMFEVMDEYRLLQKIYYFEIFKAITENDDEILGPHIEENEVKNILNSKLDITPPLSCSPSETKIESTESRQEQELRFYQVLQTYVLVNNNAELPNSTVLDQLLATEKFKNHLRFNAEACTQLNMVHQEYLRLHRSYDNKIHINLKHFTTHSLPFQLRANIFEMDKLPLNQYRKFVVNLVFFGPGKLIAAIRTVMKIPGLMVDFEVEENTGDSDFIYCRCENKPADFCKKPYRNMNERQMDAQIDPKVNHAHSYDVNIWSQHQRDVTAKDRKWLMSYYNSLHKSVYLEQKHHFTYCKIFSNCKYNFTGTKINIIVLIRPEKGCYKHNQRIEDYLYVDLHMGPTLPILLRGTVVDTDKYGHKASSS